MNKRMGDHSYQTYCTTINPDLSNHIVSKLIKANVRDQRFCLDCRIQNAGSCQESQEIPQMYFLNFISVVSNNF